jgi:hypothetical protein
MEETGRYVGLGLGKRACTMAVVGKRGGTAVSNGTAAAAGRQALYRKAGKKERGVILDRLTETTGMNRDYLATVLRNYGRKVPAVPEGKPVAVEAGG